MRRENEEEMVEVEKNVVDVMVVVEEVDVEEVV